MKLASSFALACMLAAAACGGKKDPAPAPAPAGSAAAPAGSGSAAPAAAGSGSAAPAAAGSGSAAAGSGSAASGSGSAATGSGSAAAGSGSAAGSADGSAAGSGSAAAAADGDKDDNYPHHDSDFDKLGHEERGKFMKEHVTPEMKAAFQKFDAKKYADFGCKTCHGKNPKAVHFHMPSPDLPKLDFAALKAGKQEPKIAKFMGDVVEPQMAKILGAQPFDMATQKGFGCLDCHEQKK